MRAVLLQDIENAHLSRGLNHVRVIGVGYLRKPVDVAEHFLMHAIGFKVSNGIVLICLQFFKYRTFSQSLPSRYSTFD